MFGFRPACPHGDRERQDGGEGQGDRWMALTDAAVSDRIFRPGICTSLLVRPYLAIHAELSDWASRSWHRNPGARRDGETKDSLK